MSNAWNDALDALEVQLAATQAALAAGATPSPQPVDFPVEPLPVELIDRTRALVELTEHLESAAVARLEQVRSALQVVPARRVAGRRVRTGSFVDIGA